MAPYMNDRPRKRAAQETNRAPKKAKLSKADVVRIAKKTVMSVAETKSALKALNVSLTAGAPKAVAANYFVTQGYSRGNYVGNKILLQNFYLRYYLEVQNNSDTTNGQPIVRLALIKCDQNLTSTSGNITASDVFRNDSSGTSGNPATNSHFDLAKVKLLWDIQLSPKMDGTGVNQTTTLVGSANIKINQQEQFTSDNSGLFKDGNYYFILAYQRPGDTGLTSAVTTSLQWSVNYKDC